MNQARHGRGHKYRRISAVLVAPLAVFAWLTTTAASGDTTPSDAVRTLLSADRGTAWIPGRISVGGIPARTTICARLDAATFGDGKTDASRAIQGAVNGCPSGQVVLLSAGTFLANTLVVISKDITLRGAGAGKTILRKTNGATMNRDTGPDAQPNIIIGPNRWPKPNNASSRNLMADGKKGSFTVQVSDVAGIREHEFVLIDEVSGASWQPDRLGRGQIWATPDYRVVWQFHNPRQSWDDPLEASRPTGGPAAGWFSRQDRVTAEVKEIASVDGNTITFTSPLHADFRVSHAAQLTQYSINDAQVRDAGVEDLTVVGGSNGAIRFESAAYCWAKAVEVTVWTGEGIALDNSFRIEVRDSYIHDAAWAQPGGAGYAVSLATGSAEALFENNIIVMANKVIVGRAAGAGSVFGYNYVDDGYINTVDGWIEIGLNASHMVGAHHVLFEGNYGFNWDSDHTHGNATYHTAFRNYLRCIRAPFVNPLNGRTVDDAKQTGNGPRRCIGATGYSYWMSFIGNVLGSPGQMDGWIYEGTGPGAMSKPSIWLLGWDDGSPQPYDPETAKTTLRHGNFDYLTNSVHWDSEIAEHELPPSLYLSKKPDFFNAGHGYHWPWVNPTDTTKLYTLPAKARYDAGTPFVQP